MEEKKYVEILRVKTWERDEPRENNHNGRKKLMGTVTDELSECMGMYD